MIFPCALVLWIISLSGVIGAVSVLNVDESGGKDLLRYLNKISAEFASTLVNVQWEFETNDTPDVKKKLIDLTSKAIQNAKLSRENITNNFPWKSFSNPDLRRQLKQFSEIGTLALPEEKYSQVQKIISDLDVIQQNTTICDYYNKTKCDLHYQDLQEKLETSQNEGEVLYLWTEWRRNTEPEFTKLLNSYVKLCNEAAMLNDYRSFQEYSLRNIEVEDVKREMELMWEDIKPLYTQFHAFVRKKLRDVYGEKIVPSRGPIPAHLLGNIWSENWLGISHKVIPFVDYDDFNFTATMLDQGYTPELIRRSAEDFLVSMNFTMPPHLWLNASEMSPLKKTEKCHPKTYNLYANGVGIKDCKKISLNEYLEDIRLLTKAEYMLQYRDQPFVYQTPADPGLEEAINDVMAMSASSFDNLKKLGLFRGDVTEEIRINRLFKLALDKLVSVPFLMVQEFWRWDVFNGKTVEESMNYANDLREKFQGISTFTKELTFDPGGIGSAFSKLSLAHHFLGSFLEFQIYDSLCQLSKPSQQEIELNECNLFDNVEAGEAIRKIMSLGSSKTLGETLSSVLGINKIESKSMLKYFEPLMKWLSKENADAREYIGWEDSEPKNSLSKTRRKRSLDDYSSEIKEDDIYSSSSSHREPDRFQRLVNKRSKISPEEGKTNEQETKSAEQTKKYNKLSDTLVDEPKQRRNIEEGPRGLFHSKNRRSSTDNNKDFKESTDKLVAKGKKGSDEAQKLTTGNSKRHIGSKQTMNQSPAKPNKKRSYNSLLKNSHFLSDSDDNLGNGKSKVRLTRRAQKQNRYNEDVSLTQSNQVRPRKEGYRNQRDAQGHSDSKKDISRLLHSFGFINENDDKDKIKEMKKKLKGDASSDLKSNLDSKEGSYENLVDYSRLKSVEARADAVEDKGTNKFWSMKSYLNDNGKILQSSPTLDKKENPSVSHLTSSLIGHVLGEKTVGKKEVSQNSDPSIAGSKDAIAESRQGSEAPYRHMNLDMPTLQALLQKADSNSYGQKQIFNLSPDSSDSRARSDMNQMYGNKMMGPNKYANSYTYKYGPTMDMLQFKEKKEFRDGDADAGGKSPYIIILGQMAPNMRKQLQDKGVNLLELDSKQAQLQSGANSEEKKMSDKRSRASEQIYIVPIDVKSSQHNLLKANHYAEHEHEAGHDPNTERDQESEEEQLHLEDNSKLEDKSNFYKTGKESPSEFIISWNNDKNRKIVKRSKREHKKEVMDDKMKVVRVAPMKESFLQDLSAISGSSAGNLAVQAPVVDSAQSSPIQQSTLSSLASSVLSALSPKGFAQISKAAGQRQDAEFEEESLKENGNMQPLGKKKAKLHADDDTKALMDVDPAAKGDDSCCKKIILSPCPPRCPCPAPCPVPCPCPCPCPSPCPLPCPCPCPDDCCKRIIECPPICCKPECCPDLCCKKPSECSLVNCQFKITKAKKPHERLTIMIYDRINPPAELPEPYDALAVISEILQRIQCCPCKTCCQLTEEDPDYPANDNIDQLKGNANQPQDNKVKIQELSGEMPIMGSDSPEEDETDDASQMQSPPSSVEEDKYQPKEKATPALDQLTVFNKEKLKPVFLELRKIDDLIKKRSQKE